MVALYEHLTLDISPKALSWIGDALTREFQTTTPYYPDDQHTQVEIQNFINECRARLQHVLEEKRAAAHSDSWDDI